MLGVELLRDVQVAIAEPYPQPERRIEPDASADVVYLSPDYREGMTGYKLIKSGVAAIRPKCNIVKVETNDLYEGGRMGVLLKRLGFERIGSIYVHR